VIAAPDLCEPVIGWRAWRAVERDGEIYLMSLFHRVRWPRLEALGGKCEAWHLPWRRRRHQHPPPRLDCHCGIYATTLEVASAYAPALRSRAQGQHAVVGTVALWGDVLEYTEGWRASFAYPRRLYVLCSGSNRERHAARVAAQLEGYGVPVDVIRAGKAHEVADELARVADAVEPVPGFGRGR
jgi:hypothetical protein